MAESRKGCTREEDCPETRDLAETFKVLSDASRLRILYLLATDTTGTSRVTDLAAKLGITQPAVSQHLKILKADGLVESQRTGFHVSFSFNRERMAQIATMFEHMCATVLSRCDRQLIRETSPDGPLNIGIICYSYSGITQGMVEKIHEVCGGDLIQVKTIRKYRTFTVYTAGSIRSRNEETDPITPATIDVSGYDLIVIATPVWAWKPSPAINSVVAGLKGCEGKNAVIGATYSSNPGNCIPILRKRLEKRGVRVIGEATFSRRESEDPHIRNAFIGQIIRAYQESATQPEEIRAEKVITS